MMLNDARTCCSPPPRISSTQWPGTLAGGLFLVERSLSVEKRLVGGAGYPGRISGDVRSGVVVRRRPHKAACNQMMIHRVRQQLEPGMHAEPPIQLRQVGLDRHFGYTK